MEFRVRCYQGADRPLGGYQPIVADSAKEAAEQACGERLVEGGRPAQLRATVHTMPLRGLPWTFYSTGLAS